MSSTHSIVSTAGIQDAGITDESQTGLDIAGSMTLMAWLRPSALSRRHSLVTKWNGVSSNRSFIFEVNSADKIAFSYSENGTANNITVSAAITGFAINEWRHMAMVFISAGPEVQFYLDGVPFGSPAEIAGPGTIFNGTASFRIGNFDPGVAADNFRGHIDQVKVYDDERTSAEIFSEYQEAPVAGSNLQAGYSLDNVFTDISGNGNTLTNNGTSFVEGEVHGFGGEDLGGSIDGSDGGASFNFAPVGHLVSSAGGGDGGAALVFRMRGTDTTLSRVVYWSATEIDPAAAQYGGPGPVINVVLTKKIGG